MWDIGMIAATSIFFAVAVGYTHVCWRLGRKDGKP